MSFEILVELKILIIGFTDLGIDLLYHLIGYKG